MMIFFPTYRDEKYSNSYKIILFILQKGPYIESFYIEYSTFLDYVTKKKEVKNKIIRRILKIEA